MSRRRKKTNGMRTDHRTRFFALFRHDLRRYGIWFSMDYSAFFLKNLDKDAAPKKYRNDDFRHYRQEKKLEEEGIILSPSPQANYSPSTYEYRAMPVLEMENEYGKSILPHAVKQEMRRGRRKSKFRKTALLVCLFLVMTLSTFVACDFITQGGVIATIGDWVSAAAIERTYYALASAQFDNLTDARAYSAALRMQGGAGYIAKNGDAYCVYAELYDNRETADTVKAKNEGSFLVEMPIKKIDYKRFEDKFRAAIEGYLAYATTLEAGLNQIAEGLQNGTQTLQSAKDRTQTLKDGLEQSIRQFNVLAEQMTSGDTDAVLSDMRAALGLLDNLTNDELSRPNYLCDVRYYRIQIVLNHTALCNRLSA